VLYSRFAEVAKALRHGRRPEVLELLAQGERSAEALAGRAELSVANASIFASCAERGCTRRAG
jgi:hypothetical protein